MSPHGRWLFLSPIKIAYIYWWPLEHKKQRAGIRLCTFKVSMVASFAPISQNRMCSKKSSVSASLAAAGEIYRNQQSACALRRRKSELYCTRKCNEVVNWSSCPCIHSQKTLMLFMNTDKISATQIKYHNLQQLNNDLIKAIFLNDNQPLYCSTVKSL